MSQLKLLLVEDEEQDVQVCRDCVDAYQHRNPGRSICLVECRDVCQALSKLDDSFHGAIIDLTLKNQEDGGNRVINNMEERCLRIPVFILTGTPDTASKESGYIKVLTKGELTDQYGKLLDKFWSIHNTGLNHIMGGRGKMEETLCKVYRKNLFPRIDDWERYSGQSSNVERALLRHTLDHMLQILDDDDDERYPEEVYIVPPIREEVRVGSIVRRMEGGTHFVVLSPACDLVNRRGKLKTDRILVVEVDNVESEPFWNRKGNLKNAFGNKYAYYHWLPKTSFFDGGLVNFRKVSSHGLEEFCGAFEMPPKMQISPYFVRDVVARFSSYYGRQGQPEIRQIDID